MPALEFWKTVTADHANLLESLIALLNEHGVKYCVIGGQAVNAYAEPRQKDLLDLARLIEKYPRLRERVPSDFLGRMSY